MPATHITRFWLSNLCCLLFIGLFIFSAASNPDTCYTGGYPSFQPGIEERHYNRSAPAGKATLIYSHALENVPGKSLVGIHVEFPGGAETPPHTHAGPSLVAVVLEGQVFNKIEGGELVVLKAGDSFFEHPGAHVDFGC